MSDRLDVKEFYVHFKEEVSNDTRMCLMCIDKFVEGGFDLKPLLELHLSKIEEDYILKRIDTFW